MKLMSKLFFQNILLIDSVLGGLVKLNNVCYRCNDSEWIHVIDYCSSIDAVTSYGENYFIKG